ncbi:MAG: T9SS type A sorting domain-containing protein [Ignavibacteriaceae bacterium]
MKFRTVLAIIFFVLIIFQTNSVYAQFRYEVINLELLAIPSSINDSGQIVFYDGVQGTNVIWHNGTLTSIGTLGSGNVHAHCINDSGKVVGEYDEGDSQAFISYNGNMTSLNVLSNIEVSVAKGINKTGNIAGWAQADTGSLKAVRWVNGNMQYLGYGSLNNFTGIAQDINNSGYIAGEYVNQNLQSRGFVWQNNSLTEINTFGGDDCRPVSINNINQVVGGARDQNGNEKAFLWQAGNMTNLGSLESSQSKALCINDSGQIVGLTYHEKRRAFIWEDGVMTDLNELSDTTGGWILTDATSINNLGYIIGRGTLNGQFASFLLKPSGIQITNPKADDKWIAGETDTIKWVGGLEDQLLQIELSVDSGSTFNLIAQDVPGDSGKYAWDIPDDILSKKCMIRIFDMAYPDNVDTSDVFKIKGYILTRDSSGQYEPFRTNQDQWGFWNREVDMFPPAWYQQFDYQGEDPFTGSQYSQSQIDSTFKKAKSGDFPDWVSFVNAFGIDECYWEVSLGLYRPTAVIRWAAKKNLWEGSCFGIAAASSLAFTWKDQFNGKYPDYPQFQNPITVNSNDGVKKTVNELFSHQFGNPTYQSRIGRWNVITPNQTLNEIKDMLIEDDVQLRTISIWNNNGAGGHNILPYELKRDANQNQIYYLYVYDNSHPNENAQIKIDTTGNSNNGTWSTQYAWLDWGGSKKIMLELESNVYLNSGTLPKRSEGFISPFIISGDVFEVFTNIDANTRIIDNQGNVTGFTNGLVFEEIPNSVPLMYLNGSETPPYGYYLPAENYSVILDDFQSDTVEAFFFTSNKSFMYERYGADATQTDRLFFDSGVSAINPDLQTKTISLLNIINESTQEKLTVVRSLELVQNDSVKIENPDSNKVKLISYGTAKNYDVELNYVTENGIGRFGDFDVPLSANTSHTFVPDWSEITNTELMVLVDNGNNGTIDDTLYLQNQVTGIDNDQGSLLSPNSYNLAQNHPNPFNPTTTIQYSIPQRSNVTLKVYDILGNEVATLVNEEKDRGVFLVTFNASGLVSGVYFYRIQAGSFVETKKMIILK